LIDNGPRNCEDSRSEWMAALAMCHYYYDGAADAARKCCQGGSAACIVPAPAVMPYSDAAMQHCKLDKTWETLVEEHFHDRPAQSAKTALLTPDTRYSLQPKTVCHAPYTLYPTPTP